MPENFEYPSDSEIPEWEPRLLTVREAATTLAVSVASGIIRMGKETEMVKQLAAIAILASVVSLVTVACGGGDDEDAAPPPPAAAPPPPAAAAPVSAAEAQETGPVKSGVTGTDENGVIQYSIYIVGGGSTGGATHLRVGVPPFNWEVTDLTFNVGDTVAFTVIPTADPRQTHTFSTKEFGPTTHVKYGKSATATLTFDEHGQFRYWCEIHFGQGMKGLITVQ